MSQEQQQEEGSDHQDKNDEEQEEEDKEEKLQYVKKDFFHPVTGGANYVFNQNNNSSHSSSSNYSNQQSQQPQPQSHRPWYSRHADAGSESGDDSNHFFMSEPSMSEADSSENPMRLLGVGGNGGRGGGGGGTDDDLDDSLLFLDREDEDNDHDDDDNDDGDDNPRHTHHNLGIPPPPPPPPLPPYSELQAAAGLYGRASRIVHNQTIGLPQAPQSPGNTSLSSWESPHNNRRVHIHYSPPRNYSDAESKSSSGGGGGLYPSEYTIDHNQQQQQQQQQQHIEEERILSSMPNILRTPERMVIPPRQQQQQQQQQHYSSNSTSPASEGHMQQLEDFLDDLRVNSEGKVQDSAAGVLDSNTSFESSLFPTTRQVDGGQEQVWRRERSNEPDNTQQQPQGQQGRITAIETEIVQTVSNDQSHDEHTLLMVLSDSGDERDGQDDAKSLTNALDDDGNTGSRRIETQAVPLSSIPPQADAGDVELEE